MQLRLKFSYRKPLQIFHLWLFCYHLYNIIWLAIFQRISIYSLDEQFDSCQVVYCQFLLNHNLLICLLWYLQCQYRQKIFKQFPIIIRMSYHSFNQFQIFSSVISYFTKVLISPLVYISFMNLLWSFKNNPFLFTIAI